MDKEMMEIMKSLMQEMTNGFEKVNKRLDKIETDVKELKTNQEQTNIRLDKIEIDVKELKEKIDNVYNQTADLTEFKTEVNTKLDVLNDNISNIEIVTANNWADIARLKKAK